MPKKSCKSCDCQNHKELELEVHQERTRSGELLSQSREPAFLYSLRKRLWAKISSLYDKFIIWFCFPTIKVTDTQQVFTPTIAREITEMVISKIKNIPNLEALKTPESDDDFFAEDFYLDLYKEIDKVLEDRLNKK